MSNIRVDLTFTIYDGAELSFKSPCDCSEVTGLKVYYPDAEGVQNSQEFKFTDSHGNDVGGVSELFAEDVLVKVILDTTTSKAFVQNADTNAYLEGRFKELDDKCAKLPIECGGTGATTKEQARSNLGIAAAISKFSLGTVSGGRLAHTFDLDNGLKCVIGRTQVEATFPSSPNAGSLYSYNVDIPLTDIIPNNIHQVIVSVYYANRPLWGQLQSYDANKMVVRLISTGSGDCSPYVHYMIIGKG